MMARKKPAAVEVSTVTAERAARLYRLVRFLSTAPQTRANLLRRLGLNIRGFYRDLETLRAANIHVALDGGRYSLDDDAAEAIDRLPFPDPGLTLGEARQLARGRAAGNKKIHQQLRRVEQ
jgi:hypothetical protein